MFIAIAVDVMAMTPAKGISTGAVGFLENFKYRKVTSRARPARSWFAAPKTGQSKRPPFPPSFARTRAIEVITATPEAIHFPFRAFML